MDKSKIYLDLSKCTEEEQKHVFSLLLSEKITAQIYYMIRNSDWDVLEAFSYLFFNEKDVWQICSNRSTETNDKTEITYPEFIKLFEGGDGEKSDLEVWLNRQIEKCQQLDMPREEWAYIQVLKKINSNQ